MGGREGAIRVHDPAVGTDGKARPLQTGNVNDVIWSNKLTAGIRVVAPDFAPKHVEDAVGRRREAHAVARGGCTTGGGDGRPRGVDRIEAV